MQHPEPSSRVSPSRVASPGLSRWLPVLFVLLAVLTVPSLAQEETEVPAVPQAPPTVAPDPATSADEDPVAAAEAALEAAEVAVEEAAASDVEESERIEEALDELENRLEDLQDAVEETEEESEETAGRLRERQREMRNVRDRIRRRSRDRPRDSKVSFGSDIHLEEGQVGSDLVAIGGSVYVNGEVRGDAVAVGGSVEVEGRVTGDVVAVGGRVVLGPDSEVLGTVTLVGSQVDRADGARVEGGVNEIALGQEFNFDPFSMGVGDFDLFRWGSAFEMMWELSWIVIMILLCALVVLLTGDTAESVRQKAVAAPFQAGFTGLVILVLCVPVAVVVSLILLISIVGIPLLVLVPLAFVGLWVVSLVGYTGIALGVGRGLESRFGWSLGASTTAVVVGVAAIQAMTVASTAIGIIGGFVFFFALMFGLFGFFIEFLAWTVGLGAAFLTFIDRRSKRVSPGPPPVPPTVPEVPPTVPAVDPPEAPPETAAAPVPPRPEE